MQGGTSPRSGELAIAGIKPATSECLSPPMGHWPPHILRSGRVDIHDPGYPGPPMAGVSHHKAQSYRLGAPPAGSEHRAVVSFLKHRGRLLQPHSPRSSVDACARQRGPTRRQAWIDPARYHCRARSSWRYTAVSHISHQDLGDGASVAGRLRSSALARGPHAHHLRTRQRIFRAALTTPELRRHDVQPLRLVPSPIRCNSALAAGAACCRYRHDSRPWQMPGTTAIGAVLLGPRARSVGNRCAAYRPHRSPPFCSTSFRPDTVILGAAVSPAAKTGPLRP